MSSKVTALKIVRDRPAVILRIVFAGAGCSRPGTIRNVDRYSNTGLFYIVDGNRLKTDNMPFSRSSKRVMGIREPDGIVLYGQFCSKCNNAVPKVWLNCDYCCGKVIKGVFNNGK